MLLYCSFKKDTYFLGSISSKLGSRLKTSHTDEILFIECKYNRFSF